MQGRLRANNGDALRESVLAGLGIAILPTFLCGDEIRAGRLVCLLGDWRPQEIYVNAVHPPGRPVVAKVRRFVDFLAQSFGPEPPWDAWMKDAPAPVSSSVA